ncbi:hypothetical protein [Brevundimonas sp.]|uniref:hypothetical protein n=1 Tax=Brevundimonas sp. TaxID=1871086 RepID=UPI002D2AEEB4|nr:hypothetical protein [Brevundimonas sp.]HYC74221.1 hypothetical protein [Brevundimonas sp.]
MQPPAAPPTGDADPAARLLAVVEGLDLASADGRAGIRTLLAEIERLSPGAILQQAASIELRRVGWLCGRGRAKIS